MSHHRRRRRKKNADTELDPPSFRLPDNADSSDRYELWTVRLPRSVDLATLDGCTVQVGDDLEEQQQQQQHAAAATAGAGITQFSNKTSTEQFTWQWGDAAENESFRLLLPRDDDHDDDDDDGNSSDDDDEDDDAINNNNNNKNKFLYPAKMTFARHVSIVPSIQDCSALDVAPSIETAPSPAEPVRHAYAAVPQRTGLKRRWTPPGSGSGGGTTTVKATTTAAAAGDAAAAVVKQESVTASLPKRIIKATEKQEEDDTDNNNTNGHKNRNGLQEAAVMDEVEDTKLNNKVEDVSPERKEKKKKKVKKEKKAKKEKKKKKER